MPPKLSGADIREKFLAFFESKGHTRMQGGDNPLPSCTLIPKLVHSLIRYNLLRSIAMLCLGQPHDTGPS